MSKRKQKRREDDPLDRDMSDFIRSGHFKRVLFEMRPKDTTVTLRVPQSLVDAAKKIAKARGVKYQKMMRQAIVDYVEKAA